MFLEGKVQTATIGMFFDGLEVVVIDRVVTKPGGGRPQYPCRIVRGWPGLDELKTLKRNKASEQELQQYAATIPLPQEDQVLALTVLDVTNKKGFQRFVCEVTV